jgi:hypothetical protein
MGNLGQTAYQTAATPVQNNSYMHAVIYTYAKGPWVISPYFQYSKLPTNAKVSEADRNAALFSPTPKRLTANLQLIRDFRVCVVLFAFDCDRHVATLITILRLVTL